ncbi:hypothetical protein V6N13_064154 [Hibiscus sabdariffa]|uniref:Uncharacterized protein n=2 Tax=Hibiscus sabdariffa TaxID=183260 RepID=A0ABR2R2A1_9ROSI
MSCCDVLMAAIPSSQHFSSPQMQQFGFQGVEGAMLNPLEGDSVATILIRHLPEAIPPETLMRLFSLCIILVLLVERAGKPTEHNKPQQNGVQLGKDFSQSASLLKDANSTTDPNQGSRLGSLPASEPIAPRLGVDYPFPPHLEYAYPPPDGNIFTNIINALIAVPRFYTQVLHLMNKMNIPAPFIWLCPHRLCHLQYLHHSHHPHLLLLYPQSLM